MPQRSSQRTSPLRLSPDKRLWFDVARWFAELPGDAAVHKLLEHLGRLLRADRAYLGQADRADGTGHVTHEWDDIGVPSTLGRREDLSGGSYRWFTRKLRQQKEMAFNTTDIPKRYSILAQRMEGMGTKSFLGVPIMVNGRTGGILGFHQLSSPRIWKREERLIAKMAAEILAGWLRTKSSLSEAPLPVSRLEATVFIKVGSISTAVPISKILYVESMLNYTRLYLDGEKPMIGHRTITSWESALPSSQFMRVQRSYIVNPAKIVKLNRNNGAWAITMADQREITVGRMYRPALLEYFESLTPKEAPKSSLSN